MKLRIFYKNIKHSEAVENHIETVSHKFEKFISGWNADVKWTCSVQGSVTHADVKILGPHFEYHATAEDLNMYKSFDKVVSKLEKQLSKHKEKIRHRLHQKFSEPEISPDPECAWGNYDEDEFDDAA